MWANAVACREGEKALRDRPRARVDSSAMLETTLLSCETHTSPGERSSAGRSR